MTIEEGLQAYLSTKAAIIAVVGTRIFPIIVAQQLLPNLTTNYPAITYQIISAKHNHSMNGSSQLCYKRFQVTGWAQGDGGYKTASDLMEIVRLSCDGFSGNMGTVVVQSCFLEGENDPFDIVPGSEMDRTFGRSQDYMIGYTESAPTL